MLSVIATDLDGTFLTNHESVSQTNLDAAQAVLERGIPMLFATGRPSRWLDVLAGCPGHPHAITSNGAAVVDLATREVEQCWPLDLDVVADVVRDLRAELPGVVFALEHGATMGIEPGYETVETVGVRTGALEELLQHREPLLKLVVKHPRVDTNRLHEVAAPIIGDRLTTTFSWVSPQGMLELSAPGVSKAHTLDWFCSQHGVSREGSVAFGDMPNDLEMLQWATRGYVVPGAHPSLLDSGLPVIDGDQTDAVGRTILALLAESEPQ